MTRLAVVLYTVSLRGVSAGCSPEGSAAPPRQLVREAPVCQPEVASRVAGQGDGKCWSPWMIHRRGAVEAARRCRSVVPLVVKSVQAARKDSCHPGSGWQEMFLRNVKGGWAVREGASARRGGAASSSSARVCQPGPVGPTCSHVAHKAGAEQHLHQAGAAMT